MAQAWKAEKGKTLTGNERIQALVANARQHPEAGPHARALLNGLLIVLGEVAPIPAAIFLFTSGMTGIYQVYRAHRLVGGGNPDADDATEILDDVRSQLHRWSDEQTHRALLKHLAPSSA